MQCETHLTLVCWVRNLDVAGVLWLEDLAWPFLVFVTHRTIVELLALVAAPQLAGQTPSDKQ